MLINIPLLHLCIIRSEADKLFRYKSLLFMAFMQGRACLGMIIAESLDELKVQATMENNINDDRDIQGVHREIKELSVLFEVSQALNRSLDFREVIGPVLRKLAEHMGMMRGTITILNRDTDELNIEASYGLSPEEHNRGKYRLGEGVTGKVVQTGNPAVVPRISAEPLFLDRTGTRLKAMSRDKKDISFICVPIMEDGEPIGAISVDRLFEDSISYEEDLRLLWIIAAMIGRAARLRQAHCEQMLVLEEENSRLRSELVDQFRPKNLIGNSHAIRRVFRLIQQVAPSSATVLILGESGVGKELVAQAIHYNSPRAAQPFVKVNCAALPENIVESELFGHEKGAFTGAMAQHKGRFENAEGGTIFLDEIGDLPRSTQIRLLRVLQEREVERVGGDRPIRIDVRVLAATNRKLEPLISEGRFREDLYYRLNVFPIHLPPLRERKTDIPLLADHFVEKYSRRNNKAVLRISTPAIDMLMAYHWPGNIRELENCIERAVLLSTDGVIHGNHLPPSLQTAEASGTLPAGSLEATLASLEKELIIDALKSSSGNMAKAARHLGLTERMMGLRVARYNIDFHRFRATFSNEAP